METAYQIVKPLSNSAFAEERSTKHGFINSWLSSIQTPPDTAINSFGSTSMPATIYSPSFLAVGAMEARQGGIGLDPDLNQSMPDTAVPSSTEVEGRIPSVQVTTVGENTRNQTGAPASTGVTCARKTLRKLASNDIVVLKSFSNEKCPPGLASMFELITRYSKGAGVISSRNLAQVRRARETFRFANTPSMSEIQDRTLVWKDLGEIPDVAVLMEILETAEICHDEDVDEAGWNAHVHLPLLRAALGRSRCNNSGAGQAQFRVSPWMITSASVAKQYAVQIDGKSYDEGTDMCFCIEAQKESDLYRLIHNSSWKFEHESISHSDYGLLETRPLAVSIQTKKGECWKTPLARMGTWFASHWRHIENMEAKFGKLTTPRHQPYGDEAPGNQATNADNATGAIDAATACQTVPKGADAAKNAEFCNPRLPVNPSTGSRKTAIRERPEFLPGIIIEGHDWYFVATTQEETAGTNDKRTVVWPRVHVGSTSDMAGLLKIIAFLQQLASWSAYTYMPWLQSVLEQGKES